MQIKSINGHLARCHVNGIERDVDLYLIADQGVLPGDFVLVHVGYAIQKVIEKDALLAWNLAGELANAEQRDA